MTCDEVTEFLLDYLAGDLPQAVQITFEAHLAVCRDCRNYLDSYRKTIAITRQSKGVEAESVPEELVAAVMRAQNARS
jgi:predicted anti-sigma-YlaC factor YlaD